MNLPTRQQGSSFRWQLAVSMTELIIEAVGTTIALLGITAATQLDGRPLRWQDASDLFVGLAVLPLVVLSFFLLTGYGITTAIAGATLRQRGKWTYPSVAAALYLAHSELLFSTLNHDVFSWWHTPLQLLGATIAFFTAHAGNRFLVDREQSTQPS